MTSSCAFMDCKETPLNIFYRCYKDCSKLLLKLKINDLCPCHICHGSQRGGQLIEYFGLLSKNRGSFDDSCGHHHLMAFTNDKDNNNSINNDDSNSNGNDNDNSKDICNAKANSNGNDKNKDKGNGNDKMARAMAMTTTRTKTMAMTTTRTKTMAMTTTTKAMAKNVVVFVPAYSPHKVL
ncbi:hypothetical protein QOT17_013513 [Balamuthia mandrillaris]